MSEEYSFSPSDITLSNISSLTETLSIVAERRICELAELADSAAYASAELISYGLDIYEALLLISDTLSLESKNIHKDALEQSLQYLAASLDMLTCSDKAIFSSLYRRAMSRLGIEIFEENFLFGDDKEETFVYVKNQYADEAYDVFSQSFSDPRVKYAKSFKDALKLVSDGEASYCLLPLEERGSRLVSVAELIFAEDLKINSVIPVFGFDGSADIKYALVSKQYSVPDFDIDDDLYLEIRLSADSATKLSSLLGVAESFFATVYRVNTVTFGTDEGKRTYYSVVFHSEGRGFTELLIYFALFALDAIPVGMYKNLE